MTLTLDAIALISLLAAINLLYVAGLAWFETRGLLTARFLATLTLVAAWWTLCMGLAFTNLGLQEPRLLQLSQVLSGFFGPLLLLFTLAYTRQLKRLGARSALLLLPGLFGTVSFFLLLFLDPPVYRLMATRFISGEAGFDLSIVHRELLWYELLQRAHATELLLFTGFSILVFVRWSRRQTQRRERLDGAIIAFIYFTLLVGIVTTNILPGAGFSSDWPRLSPILTFPFVLVLFRFVRQRARSVERLAREQERLVAYLPVAGLGHGEAGEASEFLEALDRPQKADAVVLFADLRAFTTYSESLSPEDLVRWVDAFFSRMSACILAERGMVDKLIGDAVLAVFGVLPELPNACENAVRCAEAMQAELERLNDEAPIAPGARMRMGIGLHYGPLVAGSVGSKARRTYTVFGDTVNTASRLEGLTRELSAEVLISDAVLEHLPPELADRFEDCGPRPIRGRQETLQVHRLATRSGSARAP